MNHYVVQAAVLAACLAGSAFAADQVDSRTEFLLSGPVEKVDAALDTVTVFGRDFTTDKAPALTAGEIVTGAGPRHLTRRAPP